MATVQVVREVLKVLDNFDRAFGVIRAKTDSQLAVDMENNYCAIYDKVLHILTDLGVKEVATVGTKFDYKVHKAIIKRPGTEYDKGVVCDKFQKGFKLGNSLIWAAMVSMAA